MRTDMNRITKTVCAGLVIAAAAAALPWSVQAQAPAKPAAEQVAVQLDIALTRWQGEKKTSSLPFVLIVGSRGNSTSMRMGVDVPVGTATSSATQTTGAQGNTPRAVETSKSETVFRNVGTDIDGRASRIDDSTFDVYINIRDSSIFSSVPSDEGRPDAAVRSRHRQDHGRDDAD
jgi:hypothetical protein